MPNITASETLALKEAFIETEQPVVYPATSNLQIHPLCAVVNCDLKETVTSAIGHGQRKIRDIWEQVNVRRVQFSDEKAFFNINTSFDINSYKRLIMKKKIYVESAIADNLREFFNTEKINIEVVLEQVDNIKFFLNVMTVEKVI